MKLWLFLSFVLHHVHSTTIGLIPNTTVTRLTSSSSSIMIGTKEECLCAMIISSNISAFNYFTNNTCQLFSNASVTDTYFSWMINVNGLFYFRSQSSQIETTDEYSTTTSAPTTVAYNCSAVSLALVGTTVFGNANSTSGTSLGELSFPWYVGLNSDKSMLISDCGNFRVLRVYANKSTGVLVTPDNIWLASRRVVYDASLLNLFVLDAGNCLMTRYHNGSLTTQTVFGSTCGSNLTQFSNFASFCMDSAGNFYIVDMFNHRIMFWKANATAGVVLAGVTGVSGNDSLHLYNPQYITLDETQGLFYVADTFNNRIVRYSLNSSVGTVVAGGNGAGQGRNQLNLPSGIYLAKSINALYIADTVNNRIVRWYLGDSEGQTIAGYCNGTAGTTALLLNTPTTLTMDSDEKYLSVQQ
ncbi:unnamed protein product [Adineta steineri]|uniref:NHL repeat containing protein-like protein n=2 Tax=Adineta steineri TaxID=433720 RepID=A0A815BLL9_9BILA|nr:unnamed protein product [Adineta steineri]CAF3854997.1 unnamed protein product [Adineta steineri]